MSHNESSHVTAPQVLIKQPGETRQFSMDFSSLLGVGETIDDPYESPDTPLVTSTPSGLTIGESYVSDSKVLFDISSGAHPTKYRIEVTVVTSEGAILVGDGILKVLDN